MLSTPLQDFPLSDLASQEVLLHLQAARACAHTSGSTYAQIITAEWA